MAGKFNDFMAETKSLLKDLITKESSKEDIERISNIDKSLDSLAQEYLSKETELKEMKELVVDQVKNTGFKVNGNQVDDSGVSETPKDIDSVLKESIDKIIQARKN